MIFNSEIKLVLIIYFKKSEMDLALARGPKFLCSEATGNMVSRNAPWAPFWDPHSYLSRKGWQTLPNADLFSTKDSTHS